MIPEKAYALSCDRNSDPILNVFKEKLVGREQLLEIGSGTGQHAVFMAPFFPKLTWTLTDREENHKAIIQWLFDYPRANLRGPLSYDLEKDSFPEGNFDTVFTANTIHIISWGLALKMFEQVSSALPKDGLFLIYGAFNYDGKFTSESNERFEKWLKDRDEKSGIRNFEDVVSELSKKGMDLFEDIEMPANNRMLVFIKK